MLSELPHVLEVYPGFVPGLLVAFVVSVLASGAVARWLGIRRSLAWLLLMGFGAACGDATPAPGERRLRLRPRRDLRHPPLPAGARRAHDAQLEHAERSPRGPARPGHRAAAQVWRKGALVVVAVGMLVAVETVQALAPALGRRCESGDVVDNVTGLLVGLAIGNVIGYLLPNLARGDDDTPRLRDDVDPGMA